MEFTNRRVAQDYALSCFQQTFLTSYSGGESEDAYTKLTLIGGYMEWQIDN